jgi:hypothetical protein
MERVNSKRGREDEKKEYQGEKMRTREERREPAQRKEVIK